jgi:hypothetical protein
MEWNKVRKAVTMALVTIASVIGYASVIVGGVRP